MSNSITSYLYNSIFFPEFLALDEDDNKRKKIVEDRKDFLRFKKSMKLGREDYINSVLKHTKRHPRCQEIRSIKKKLFKDEKFKKYVACYKALGHSKKRIEVYKKMEKQ